MNISEFKNAVGKFPTGVSVISTRHEDNLFGFTANSFVSVSLDPCLISFCLNKKSFSLSAFNKADHFVINILSSDQGNISDHFARSIKNKFDGIKYTLNDCQIPLIDGSIAILECKKYNQFDCGDHIIFIGKVENTISNDEKNSLIYYGKQYRELT